MSGIREVLEREGIEWGGRMDCPRCKQVKKVTANESIGVAKCWKCNATWTESGQKIGGAWSNELVQKIAEQCQAHLPNSSRAMEWLTKRRRLPKDVNWLQAHALGAMPKLLDISTALRTAKERFEEERDEAYEACDDEKDRKIQEVLFEAQENRLREFEKTVAKLSDPMWEDAVVYIYSDGRNLPISLNVRQHLLEKGDGTKCCFRVQPVPGRRGVFCPVPVAGEGWGKMFPPLIAEGEHNWLTLCAKSDQWSSDSRFALAGFAMGGKNGADAAAAKAILGKERPLVLYDNDTISSKTNKPGGWDLVESLYAYGQPHG